MTSKPSEPFLRRVFNKPKPTATSSNEIGLKLLNQTPEETESGASEALVPRDGDKDA